MKIPEYPEVSSLASSDLLIVETTGGTKKVTEETLKSDIQNGMQEELTFDNAPTESSTNPVTSDGVYSALGTKVDKVIGKGLSTNDFSDDYLNKLKGLPTSSALTMILQAKQNVISGGTTGQILKKASSTTGDFTWGDEETGIPTGGTTGQVLTKKSNQDGDVDWETPQGTGDMLKSVYDTDDDGKVDAAENADTVNNHTVASDVPADAVFTDTVYDDTEVRGLINGKISSTEKGANSGVATLDANGKVPSSQLPSYVDDVIEGYYNNLNDTFYKDISYTIPITPEESKIYISIDTNKEYRWSGSVYAPVNAGLALGETSGTAYEGSKGKANADAISGIKNGATINSFSAVESALSGKADAVQGKGLSTNDYTDADKAIVSGVTSALNDKVDKVSGKQLSTEDFTTAEKTKLGNLVDIESIGSGLNLNTTTHELSATGISITIDTEMSDTSTNPVQNKVITGALDGKVDKVQGKGLSTEDYTTAEQTKLSGIETGAEVNDISSISVNGTAVTPDANKNVALTIMTNAVNDLVNYYLKTETYTKTEVDALIAAISSINFEVVSSLPTTDISTTTIYLVPKASAQTSNVKDEYINLDGTTSGWEKIGDTEIDLTNYVQKSSTTGLLKNDGTIDTNSYALASVVTDILDGQAIDSFSDVETALAGKADTSDIPVITGKADKVTSATSGNFAGLDSNGNLTDSGSKASDFLTSHQDITGKADKVSNATSGNFAGLDSNGNLTDSGSKASDFLTSHQDISGKQNKTLDTPIVVDGSTVTTVETALSAINTLAAAGGNPISTTTTDPGEGSALTTNNLLIVVEE